MHSCSASSGKPDSNSLDWIVFYYFEVYRDWNRWSNDVFTFLVSDVSISWGYLLVQMPLVHDDPLIKKHLINLWDVLLTSPSWVRTNDPSVNSRMLYRWAIEDYLYWSIPSKLHTKNHPFSITLLGYALDLLVTVSSMRYRTSTSALSTSSSSRGLTNLTLWDISSWGGLHA